jgi:dihydrofolate synthase/folylpolyglutamate synthase
MLASILQEAGYKTGLYTSPHLKSFTERIRINGAEISQTFVVDFVNRILPEIDTIKPSFFEITVAMAFEYFAVEKVDVAIVEVGLGGRLDSTNVIIPEVSVITNIGFDHKDILGNTLLEIASEKAGIIKPNVPVVVSERQVEMEQVFIAKAKESNASYFFASDEYDAVLQNNGIAVIRNHEVILQAALPLGGSYQRKNIPGVLKTIDLIRQKGFKITKEQVQLGLENVITNTHLKGRWQKLRERPLMICDTGHNIDGIKALVQQIQTLKFNHLHMVIGVVKDKDVTEILSLLPKQATCYFCQANIPRAMDASLLAEKAHAVGLRGEVIPDVNEAKRKALKNASPDDFIFIGGSTFVVAELEEL